MTGTTVPPGFRLAHVMGLVEARLPPATMTSRSSMLVTGPCEHG